MYILCNKQDVLFSLKLSPPMMDDKYMYFYQFSDPFNIRIFLKLAADIELTQPWWPASPAPGWCHLQINIQAIPHDIMYTPEQNFIRYFRYRYL